MDDEETDDRDVGDDVDENDLVLFRLLQVFKCANMLIVSNKNYNILSWNKIWILVSQNCVFQKNISTWNFYDVEDVG